MKQSQPRDRFTLTPLAYRTSAQITRTHGQTPKVTKIHPKISWNIKQKFVRAKIIYIFGMRKHGIAKFNKSETRAK